MSMGGNDTYKNKLLKIFKAEKRQKKNNLKRNTIYEENNPPRKREISIYGEHSSNDNIRKKNKIKNKNKTLITKN